RIQQEVPKKQKAADRLHLEDGATDFSYRIRGRSNLAVQVCRQKAGIQQPSSRLWDSQVGAGPKKGLTRSQRPSVKDMDSGTSKHTEDLEPQTGQGPNC
ncbi:hypothetical protein P7K49_000487, partial [Saguinus oedipus]